MARQQSSNRLYYDLYQWCGRFRVSECSALRQLDHRQIDRTIDLRRRWGMRLINNPVGSWLGVWGPVEITDRMIENLHRICDFFLSDDTPRKVRIQEDTLFIYCNDPSLLDRVETLEGCRRLETTQIKLEGRPGTVHLRSSDYSLRTYLRSVKLAEPAATSLRKFLLAQQDVRLSPSLTWWCGHPRTIVKAHYFLDHDSASTSHMLDLVVPGLVKRSMPIDTDK
jgi:hypothetical protein